MKVSERREARAYWHGAIPWSSCNGRTRGLCLRCVWWGITGKHKRRLDAHLEMRAAVKRLFELRKSSTDVNWRLREIERDTHPDRVVCAAVSRGIPCKRFAVRGTRYCWTHSGITPRPRP